MRHASDERLARLTSRGDARAFAALYERYHQPLYRLCLSIVRSPDDARDALQSAFERAFAALGAQEREVAVRPWLFRIAHNESISLLRRRRPGEGPVDAELASPHTVERAYEQRTQLSALVADLESLPERQRSVLLMRELNGLSIEDIAAAMSMSGGAVKQALFEARSSLHDYAEGREMACDDVRRAISDGDGRALRSRRFRAHLRGCAACTEFRSLIHTREAHLRLLAPPLPAAAAAAMLSGVLGSGAGTHAGAAAAAPAVAAAKGGAAALALKGATGLALTAAIGVGAAQIASHHAAHARSRGDHARGSHAGTHVTNGAAQSGRRAHTNGTSSSAHHSVTRQALPSGSAPAAGGSREHRGAASAGVPVRAHGAPAGVPVRAHGAPELAHRRAVVHPPQRAHGNPPQAKTPSTSHKSEQAPAHEHPHTSGAAGVTGNAHSQPGETQAKTSHGSASST
jgi:RNA polymerase sigma factor (sigma-70 family)